MIKRILVPLDGSKLAEKALPYAEALAQKFEAELILVRVLQPTLQPVPVIAGYGEIASYYPPAFQDESEANLSKLYLKAAQEKLRLPTRTEVLEGRPEADVIIDMARRESVDLIVMCTHGRSGVNRLVHGSVASAVLQHAPCPVFLVRAQKSEC